MSGLVEAQVVRWQKKKMAIPGVSSHSAAHAGLCRPLGWLIGAAL